MEYICNTLRLNKLIYTLSMRFNFTNKAKREIWLSTNILERCFLVEKEVKKFKEITNLEVIFISSEKQKSFVQFFLFFVILFLIFKYLKLN